MSFAPLSDWRSRLTGRRYLWLLAPPWHNVPTRQNHFAQRLARLGAEVLYVENPPALSSVIKQRRWREFPLRREGQIEEIEPRLHVMSAALSFPGMKRSDAIASVNGKLIARQVKHYLQKHGWTSYLCWCRVPAGIFPLRHLAPETTVYDITDDYELYEKDARACETVRKRERLLLAQADHVFITSEELRKKPAIAGARPFLAPNGVDYDLFSQGGEPGHVHSLIAAIKKPIIGYVGLTSHWMDFTLLELLGQKWPGQVVMVGPVAAEVEARAFAIPGIVWAGFVPQPELPPYLRGFDVCIMPHLANELRRRSNPLKICEYLAMGKPFVSVDLPAVQTFRDVIDVAADRDDFIRVVAANLASAPNAQVVARRREIARSFSWDRILETVLQQLYPPLRAAA
jgi:glycosyltransferase involved in cell wall biosynthesis